MGNSKGHAYYSTTGFNISDDNKLVAFGVDIVSRRQYQFIHIKNSRASEIYKDRNTTGPSAWANDNKTLFLTHLITPLLYFD